MIETTEAEHEEMTGERWLQHASRYLHTYKYNGEWLDADAHEAMHIIATLIKNVSDTN